MSERETDTLSKVCVCKADKENRRLNSIALLPVSSLGGAPINSVCWIERESFRIGETNKMLLEQNSFPKATNIPLPC